MVLLASFDRVSYVSGPRSTKDSNPIPQVTSPAEDPTVEIYPARKSTVGNISVKRALPTKQRRTIGAWCFADHFGPQTFNGTSSMEIGPHPHIGLHTVTWLLEGEIIHKDSLGTEQLIRPGQLNLMSAGRGAAHSEEHSGRKIESIHGIQFWIAQPENTRNSEPAFEHHKSLPRYELKNAVVTVLIGSYETSTSPARKDTPIVGVQIDLSVGASLLELNPAFEYGVIVLQGEVATKGKFVMPGMLTYLGKGREELEFVAHKPSIILLFGGEPFKEPTLMWWNFVARTKEEIAEAYSQWQSHSERFGKVNSNVKRIDAPTPHWMTSSR